MPNSKMKRVALLAGAMLMAAVLSSCASAPEPSGSASSTGAPPTSSDPSPSPSASTPETADPDDPATWIVTEDSIGPVHLGDTFSEARDAVRSWTVDDACSWTAFWNAPDNSLTAYFSHDNAEQDGTVDTIDVAALVALKPSDGPRTSDGIGMGSTRDEVRAAYPDAEEQTPTIGDATMLRVGDGGSEGSLFFTFAEGSDTVSAITVTSRDEPPYEVCG